MGDKHNNRPSVASRGRGRRRKTAASIRSLRRDVEAAESANVRAVRRSSRASTRANGAASDAKLRAALDDAGTHVRATYQELSLKLQNEIGLTPEQCIPVLERYLDTCDFAVFAPPEPDPNTYPPRFVANDTDAADKVLTGEDMNRRLRIEEVAMDRGARIWKYHAIKEQAMQCTITKSQDGQVCIQRTPFTIQSLAARPVGNEGLTQATEMIEWLKDQPARAESCIFEDSAGVPIVAYFGVHEKTVNGKLVTVNDGLSSRAVLRRHHAVQTLFHRHPHPIKSTGDCRHKRDVDDNVIVYPILQDPPALKKEEAEDGEIQEVPENQDLPVAGVESKGIMHLDFGWMEQGHPEKGLQPSKDLMGQHNIVRHCDITALGLAGDQDIAREIDIRLRVAMPELWGIVTQAYKAGHRWQGTSMAPPGRARKPEAQKQEAQKQGQKRKRGQEDFKLKKEEEKNDSSLESDLADDWSTNGTGNYGGPFTGRAILWKLCVGPHRDSRDYICAIYNSGSYEGAAAVFPDIGVKLRYGPGELIIFRSDALWHAVEDWKPKPMRPGDILTPGRVAWVHFIHQAAVDRCKDKPNNWNVLTSSGRFPHLARDHIAQAWSQP